MTNSASEIKRCPHSDFLYENCRHCGMSAEAIVENQSHEIERLQDRLAAAVTLEQELWEKLNVQDNVIDDLQARLADAETALAIEREIPEDFKPARHSSRLIEQLKARLAATEGEPVAWIHPADLEKCLNSEVTATVYSVEQVSPDGAKWIPLYAIAQEERVRKTYYRACSKCGMQVSIDDRYCQKCGDEL